MNGTLDASGVFEQSGVSVRSTATISLKSSAANRAIEISTTGGEFFFTPEYDCDTPDGLAVVICAPITDFRITGAAGDYWEYLL